MKVAAVVPALQVITDKTVDQAEVLNIVLTTVTQLETDQETEAEITNHTQAVAVVVLTKEAVTNTVTDKVDTVVEARTMI